MQSFTAPIPEGLDLIQEPGKTIIRKKWFSPLVWFLILFAIIWNGFLCFFLQGWFSGIVGSFGNKGATGGDIIFEIILLLFPLGHVVVGLGLIYVIPCMFLNVTDIIIHPEQIKITTHPLPWIGNKTLSSSEFVDFAVRKRISQNDNSTSITYSIVYVTPQNREKTLTSGFRSETHVQYICGFLKQTYTPQN